MSHLIRRTVITRKDHSVSRTANHKTDKVVAVGGCGRGGQKAYVSPGAAVFTISCAGVISYLLSYWEEIISIQILSTCVCRS